MDVRATITGIQEAQAANIRLMAEVRPQSGLGRAVQYAISDLNRYAVSITHVDTGALRASHRQRWMGEARAQLYLDPGARNPRTGALTSRYGPVENARGGAHAFYQRTYDERGEKAATRALMYVLGHFRSV